jgi:hypothetical protein
VNDLSDYVDEAVGFIDTLKSYLFTGENGWLQLASDTGVEMTNLRMLASDITNVANLHFKEDLGGTIQNVTSINDVLLQDVSGVDIPQSLEIACDTTVGGDLSVSGGLIIENDSQNPTLTLWSKLTGNQSPTIDLLRNSSTFGADGQYDWRITNEGGNFRLQTQGTSVGFDELRDMIYINPIGAQFTISDGLTPIVLDGTTTTINGNVISSTEPTDDTHLTNKVYVDTADNLKRDLTNESFTNITTDEISVGTGGLQITGGNFVNIDNDVTIQNPQNLFYKGVEISTLWASSGSHSFENLTVTNSFTYDGDDFQDLMDNKVSYDDRELVLNDILTGATGSLSITGNLIPDELTYDGRVLSAILDDKRDLTNNTFTDLTVATNMAMDKVSYSAGGNTYTENKLYLKKTGDYAGTYLQNQTGQNSVDGVEFYVGSTFAVPNRVAHFEDDACVFHKPVTCMSGLTTINPIISQNTISGRRLTYEEDDETEKDVETEVVGLHNRSLAIENDLTNNYPTTTTVANDFVDKTTAQTIAGLKTFNDDVVVNSVSFGGLNTRVNTAEGEIDTLQTGLTTAEGEIDTLQTGLNTAESAIVTLQTGKLNLTGGTVTGDLNVDGIFTYDKARCGTTGEIFEDNIRNSTALSAGVWVRIMTAGNNIGGTLVVALSQSGRHCYYEIKFSSLFWSESTLRVVNQSAFGTGNIGVGGIRLQSSAVSNGYIGTAVDIYIAQSINASEVTVNLKNAYTDDDYFLVDFTPNPTALNGGVDIKTLGLDLNDITFGGVRANQSGDVISDFKFSREGLLTTSSADVTGDLAVGGDLNITGNISLPVGVGSQIRVDYVAADEGVSTDRVYANDYRVASNTMNSIQIGMRQNILSGSGAYQAGWLSFNGVIDENSSSPLYRYICPYATRLRYLSIQFDDTSQTPSPTVGTGGVLYRMKFTFYVYQDVTPSFATNYPYNTYRSISTMPSGNGSTLLGNVVIFTGFGENLRYTSYRTSDSATLLVDLTCQQDKCLSVYYKMEMFGDNDSLTPQAFSNIGSEFKITLHGQQVPDVN